VDFKFDKIEEGKYKLTIISEDEEGTFEQEPLVVLCNSPYDNFTLKNVEIKEITHTYNDSTKIISVDVSCWDKYFSENSPKEEPLEINAILADQESLKFTISDSSQMIKHLLNCYNPPSPLPTGLGTYSSNLSWSITGLEEFLKEKKEKTNDE
jgi:hypothetical protein